MSYWGDLGARRRHVVRRSGTAFLALANPLFLAGARPSNIPVDQVTEFLLKLNLRTAKELGITMPTTLLAR